MDFDVFISSARQDKATADAACATLEANGIKCWIAPRDIPPGQNWSEGVMAGINQARLMVLIFSANANESTNVQREVERAIHRRVPVIPFRIENVAPEHGLDFFLSLPNWLDAFAPPLEPHLRALVKAVKDLLQLPEVEGDAVTSTAASAHTKTRSGVDPRPALPPLAILQQRPIPVALGLVGVIAVLIAVGFAAWPTQPPPETVVATQPASETTIAAGDGKVDPDIMRYDDALRRNPRDADAFFDRGLIYYRRGQYDLAIRDYDQAIRIKPNDSKAFFNRGLAYDLKGEAARAIQDYDQAIRLSPDDASAFNNRGIAYTQSGVFERAILDFTEAVRLKPDYADALFNRGNAYHKSKQYDRAIGDYDRSIALAPSADAYLNRAVAYADKNDFDRAIRDDDDAIRLQPDYALAFDGRCRYRALANKDLTAALSDCNRAVDLAGAASAYASRGLLYFRLARYREAIGDCDEVIKRSAKSAKALYVRGLSKRRVGDVADGNADIATAKALDSTVADYYARYGVTP